MSVTNPRTFTDARRVVAVITEESEAVAAILGGAIASIAQARSRLEQMPTRWAGALTWFEDNAATSDCHAELLATAKLLRDDFLDLRQYARDLAAAVESVDDPRG